MGDKQTVTVGFESEKSAVGHTHSHATTVFHDYADMMYLSLPLGSLTTAHYISQNALAAKIVKTQSMYLQLSDRCCYCGNEHINKGKQINK